MIDRESTTTAMWCAAIVAMTMAAVGAQAADETADRTDDTEKAIVEPNVGVTDKVTHADSGYGEMHPLDIPDTAGLFIYSADGQKALRLYGSVRVWGILDDRQNFHPFDLNLPQIPTGDDDVEDINSQWTIEGSRIGMDGLVGRGDKGGAMLRLEFDWKGTDESFRIRQLFFRAKHWVFGKTWATTSNVPVMPLTVDGHLMSAGLGARPVQARYYNRTKNLKYQVGFEYSPPGLVKPDEVAAEGRVVIPNLAGRLSFENETVDILVAAQIKPNRVQFTSEAGEAQNLVGYGGVVAGKVSFNKENILMFSANANIGTAGGMADFAYTDIDLIYNPGTGEFENSEVYGGYLAFEHRWSESLSSTIGVGYIDVRTKPYQDDLTYSSGYKPLVNLFYRPTDGHLKGLTVGAEVEHAARTNLDASTSSTTRASLLIYYDF
jgi:hypothetical protein